MTIPHADRGTRAPEPVPGWNDTATPYERDATIERVVGDRVRENPDAVALDGPGGSMTYGELDRRSDVLAGVLAPFVTGPDQCVGVFCGRSTEAVVAFLGVMKAGAAYVPLEVGQPAARLSFMVADTGARVVLAPSHLAHAAQALGEVAVLRTDPPLDGTGPPARQLAGLRSLANVMYTSGSTGRPKGVAVEHRGVLRYVRGGRDLVPRREDRVLHVGQLGFDASTYEIWAALCNGATLVIHPEGRFDPAAVGRTISDFGVTMGMFTAGQLHLMVDGAPDSLASYRVLISAGDVLSPGHAARLRAAHPHVRLFNAYGPTEATVTASVYEVRDVTPGRSVPIGRPLANTTLYVVGDDGRPCATGEVGELYVGGDGVARGYLGLAELTAERFVDDPYGPPGGRLYRTGDLVRLTPGAQLEFLGRRDDQVKIRGYLVEPAEVAAALGAHPGVDEVEVVVRESAAGVRQLIAFVTTHYDVDAARLRRFARRRLPEYMVPSRVVVVAEMPRTTVGKNDRRALLDLDGPVAPRTSLTPMEAAVAKVWSRVLETDDVTADDDFFESGGDSLLALHLVTELERDTGATIDLECVFDERTLARVARRVARLRAAPAPEASSRLPELATGAPTSGRTSITQAQACFLSELAGDALPYQANAVLDFDGPLDAEVLRRALEVVVRRNEILRTSLPKVLGVRVLRVHDDVNVPLEVVDLRGESDPDAALSELRERCFARRVNLDVAPLVAWTLARLGEDHWSLIQVEHHVVHDGWSFATLVGEIAAAYRDLAAGRVPDSTPTGPLYSEFAEWQNLFSATDEGRRQVDYWREVLADVPAPPALATDRVHPVRRSYKGASLRQPLGVDLVDRVHRVASRAGATPYGVMLTTFLLLLARLSGDDEVVVGSGLANRRLRGTEQVLGMFVNTVVVRADLGGDPSIRDALRRVSRIVTGALDNQEVAFEEVVRALDPPRRPGHHPFYDHLFSFHDTPFPSLEIDGLNLRVVDTLSNGSAKADLNVVVVNDRGRDTGSNSADDSELTVVWEYSSDVFDEDTARGMLDAYVTLLGDLAGDVDRPLAVVEMTTPEQRTSLVDQPGSSYERDATVDQVFSQRAVDDPDAIALSVGKVDLTYAELDASAGRFARRLATLGVSPGDRVGVVDDRSAAMVVSLLGALRAGAVYVGLDPATPPARRSRILRDAGLAFVCVSADLAPRVRDWGPDVDLDVVEVDETGLGATRIATSRRPVSGAPSHAATDPAYVSFTSGSTGEPKGVVVSHRGVVRLVRGTNYVDLGPGDVVLAAAPLAFDASTFEILGSLICGARVVVAPPGPWSARELSGFITSTGVSTAYFSAGLFHQLVDFAPEALASMRQVIAGGDVLSSAHVNRLLAGQDPRFALVNGYGPTEGTTFSYCHRLRGGERVEGPVPIGRAVANTTGVVVDSSGHLVPDGLAGELWIGGDGVALGYAGRPDLTAERFIENPFGGALGDRLYRTGDRVRRRDGVMHFIGRVDRQVKIRGFRVEPSEVEAALVALPGVARAHVAATKSGRDDTRLIAYLVAPEGEGDGARGSDDADAARREVLAASLPPYMIPSSYVWVDELPLRANGKVDASRLPEPPSAWFLVDPSDPNAPLEAFVARRVDGASGTEQTLIALWQEVLGVRVIGLDDDFFDLGGHSLLAVELLAAIERTFGVQLPLASMFSSPTVAEMARVLGEHGTAVPDSLVALTTTGRRVPIFAVTAGDGNVVGFGPLARRLGPEQPFYALQPHGLDSAAAPHRSVEAMARHYLDEVHKVQPRGPYVLAGRCFGSLVAYEMARQLEERGERVAVLASIDSGGPLWRERHLANEVLYDPMMNEARVRAADDGIEFGDPFADAAEADRFTRWLAEPWVSVGGVELSRYVGAAYRARPDVQAAFPIDDAANAAAVARWAWVSGPREMGMQRSLMVDPGATGRYRGANSPRWRVGARRAVGRVGDSLNAATSGRIPALSRRRRARVLALAAENVTRYRAGPLRAPVVLLHASGEHFAHQRREFAKWYGLDVARIEEHEVEATHHGVLREPGVGALAETLRLCVDEALARVNGD